MSDDPNRDDREDDRRRRDWEWEQRHRRHQPPENIIAETAYQAGRRAAHEEIRDVFMSFGIDLEDPKSRGDFFENLTYLRNARTRGRQIGMLVLGGIATVIAGALSTFLPSWFHK